MKHGKKYTDSVKAYDRAKLYEVKEALQVAVDTSKAKFDETVEVHVRLGVDSRHADSAGSWRLSFCRTAPVKPSACSYSAKTTACRKLWMPVRITLARMNSSRNPGRRLDGLRRRRCFSDIDGRCWPFWRKVLVRVA